MNIQNYKKNHFEIGYKLNTNDLNEIKFNTLGGEYNEWQLKGK